MLAVRSVCPDYGRARAKAFTRNADGDAIGEISCRSGNQRSAMYISPVSEQCASTVLGPIGLAISVEPVVSPSRHDAKRLRLPCDFTVQEHEMYPTRRPGSATACRRLPDDACLVQMAERGGASAQAAWLILR